MAAMGAVLVIDTCGEGAGVALAVGAEVRAVELAARGASSGLVAAVRGLLQEAGVELRALAAVGVVRGPGSFTGVRVGLAAAKGLCEAAGVRMVAVSRLEVLAQAAGLEDGVAALDAGRGQLYLREQCGGVGREWLGDVREVEAMQGKIVVAEEAVAQMFAGRAVVLHKLRAADALPVVRQALLLAPEDAALVDALYLREEADIYGAKSGVKLGGEARR